MLAELSKPLRYAMSVRLAAAGQLMICDSSISPPVRMFVGTSSDTPNSSVTLMPEPSSRNPSGVSEPSAGVMSAPETLATFKSATVRVVPLAAEQVTAVLTMEPAAASDAAPMSLRETEPPARVIR